MWRLILLPFAAIAELVMFFLCWVLAFASMGYFEKPLVDFVSKISNSFPDMRWYFGKGK